MTNQEQWPIGTKVKFNYEGLISKGVIIKDGGHIVVVLIDESAEGGWIIESSWDDPTGKYFGRRGWNVPYSKLERCETKLGNSL